jgi:hypothetical protein
MMYRAPALALLLVLVMGGCTQYRLASFQDMEIPTYEPRVVIVPPTCDALIHRAATEGMSRFSETEAREVIFCQQQQIIRTQEEEAAAKRLEAHASAARFVIQTATFAVTSLVAILAWVF